MGLSRQDLVERWTTEEGTRLLAAVVEALQKYEAWEHILTGFPGVDEIENGKDLRGARLVQVDLEGADLGEVNLKYARLEHANLSHAYLRNTNLEYANLGEANLNVAQLNQVMLKGAYLVQASLVQANLAGASLMSADLSQANLNYASFFGANLGGSDLSDSNIRGATFERADLNGTKIYSAAVGATTRFALSNHLSAFFDYSSRAAVDYYFRRSNWEVWYYRHEIWRRPVRFFWWITDYGTSWLNVARVFFGSAFLFAIVYWACPNTVEGLATYQHTRHRVEGLKLIESTSGETLMMPLRIEEEQVTKALSRVRVFGRAVYFSIVTMTTLGFGDIHASATSLVGQALLSLQVLWGYVLLGAMITVLGIQFQAEGPVGAQRKSTHSRW